jgi:hypothetical protein
LRYFLSTLMIDKVSWRVTYAVMSFGDLLEVAG